jgi:RNA polymerase sigma-70 factor (ECF subfamily)
MDDREFLAKRFEEHRGHLRGVAFRMLGSLAEADDAVQEAWLRLARSESPGIANLRAWLTTVVARVSLDMLRSRSSRREESLDGGRDESVPQHPVGQRDPESEAVLADSVGLALLVVLDTLTPAERLAFVLHDLFGASFDDIATVIRRSPEAARQLASRARRRVRGTPTGSHEDIARQREVIDRFLAALRAGDVEGLVAVLDPDLVVHADPTSLAAGGVPEIRGARTWASRAIAYARGARFIRPALVDGSAGVILAPRGKLLRALAVTSSDGRITRIEIIGDPERLESLELGVLE